MTVDQKTAIFYNPIFNNLAIVIIPAVAGEEDMWMLVAGSNAVH